METSENRKSYYLRKGGIFEREKSKLETIIIDLKNFARYEINIQNQLHLCILAMNN